MNHKLSVKNIGNATSLFLVITFVLCVGFDLIFPEYAMYRVWMDLLPGFEWISWRSFITGMVETYVYGWYFALVWVSLYNFFVARQEHI